MGVSSTVACEVRRNDVDESQRPPARNHVIGRASGEPPSPLAQTKFGAAAANAGAARRIDEASDISSMLERWVIMNMIALRTLEKISHASSVSS